MKPTNEIEKKALDMLNTRKSVHGIAREILLDMMMREDETEEE